MRPLFEAKIELADGRPVIHGGKPLMKHPMMDYQSNFIFDQEGHPLFFPACIPVFNKQGQ